jgi:hypothetical protein
MGKIGFGGPLLVVLAASLLGCGSPEPTVVVPERPVYNEWLIVEPEGAVCGNGSQYRFFVNYSDVSNDLVVAFEPGGACWDYESCTGKNGIRGAANVDGIPDLHMDVNQFIVPFFQRAYTDYNVTHDWNLVYVPYCTGDVHGGNAVAVYSDPDGEDDDITFHHSGHANVMAVIDWLAQEFEDVPRLLATGCSAGGAGATINYYFLRSGLPRVGRGFLLADSGPIMPTPSYSEPLHNKVYESWNVESMLDLLPAGFDPGNFGSINHVIADAFPDDRLVTTYFRRDYNFTLYSYERFYDFPPKEEIMDMWWEDTQKLVAMYEERENLAYYIPYWRALNDSHCTTLISFAGSGMEEHGIELEDYVRDLLDERVPLASYVESPRPGVD